MIAVPSVYMALQWPLGEDWATDCEQRLDGRFLSGSTHTAFLSGPGFNHPLLPFAEFSTCLVVRQFLITRDLSFKHFSSPQNKGIVTIIQPDHYPIAKALSFIEG